MSYSKAQDLLRLADMAAARYDGVSLHDIAQEFGCDHRTAQRMTRALETAFPLVEAQDGDDRRRRWRLPRADARLLAAQGLRDSEVAALGMAATRATRDGAPDEARRLLALRDRLLAAMPGPHARRAEADAEALLEAQGFASRPGPRAADDAELMGVLTEALRAPWELRLVYCGAAAEAPRERLVEPHGLLLGIRRYLVARPSAGDGVMRRFRLDRIQRATLTERVFARQPDFDLAAYAARAFGSFHSDSEYGEVVWRFAPRAAAAARQFLFHPDQTATEEEDGSLTVRFHASGHLEMAWHLYQWGDAVEVLAPEALRQMVQGYRRSDFPALP